MSEVDKENDNRVEGVCERERRKKHECTTSRQVLDFVIDKAYITIPLDHKGKFMGNEFDAAAYNIRQLVNKLGYKRDKKNCIVASACTI